MRRPERIGEILKELEEKWKKVPDQRLGQVLFNYFGYSGDVFNIEDDHFGVEVFQ